MKTHCFCFLVGSCLIIIGCSSGLNSPINGQPDTTTDNHTPDLQAPDPDESVQPPDAALDWLTDQQRPETQVWPDQEPPPDLWQPPDVVADWSRPDLQMPDVSPDVPAWPDTSQGQFVQEGDDFADCLVGCTNEPEAQNLSNFLYSGYMGQIDSEMHIYEGGVQAADSDVFAFVAPARTMIEFSVEALTPSSAFQPVIYTSDGFTTLTYNDHTNAENTVARTTIAFPYASGLPIFVAIEDLQNYLNYETGGPFGGGSGYEYQLTIRMSPFEPTDLGTMIVGGPSVRRNDDVLGAPGDTRYYRLAVDPSADVHVMLTPTGTADFYPVLAALNTAGGQVAWPAIGCPDEPGPVETDFATYEYTDEERIFAVIDCDGQGGPAFTYDLVVTAE